MKASEMLKKVNRLPYVKETPNGWEVIATIRLSDAEEIIQHLLNRIAASEDRADQVDEEIDENLEERDEA